MKTLNMWMCQSSSKLAPCLVDQRLTDHTARISWSSPREKSHHVHTTHTHWEREKLYVVARLRCASSCAQGRPSIQSAPDGRRTVCGFAPEESGRKNPWYASLSSCVTPPWASLWKPSVNYSCVSVSPNSGWCTPRRTRSRKCNKLIYRREKRSIVEIPRQFVLMSPAVNGERFLSE